MNPRPDGADAVTPAGGQPPALPPAAAGTSATSAPGRDSGRHNARGNPQDAARWRLSFHESAHALIGFALSGRPPVAVTLHRGRAFAAICIGAPCTPAAGQLDPAAPVIGQPADLRRAAEVLICWYLAGDLGERYACGREDGYTADSADALAAEKQARSLAQISPRAAELLAAAAAEARQPTDAEQARAMALAITGSDTEAMFHLALMGEVTRQLLDAYGRQLIRLATVLFSAGQLDSVGFREAIGLPAAPDFDSPEVAAATTA
jgi:hypothetical protein